jgi:hypothetical protein
LTCAYSFSGASQGEIFAIIFGDGSQASSAAVFFTMLGNMGVFHNL